MPFWSVVVPLYNKEDFIEDTLRSVLGQVGNELFEVIVVDDGSRDQGPARVLALGDPRVRLVRQQNGGVSAARNRGIEEARGEWVAFLDADDLWHPQAFRAFRRLLNVYPKAEILGGAYVRVASQHVANFEFSPHSGEAEYTVVPDLPATILRRGMPFFTSSVVIKRSLLRSLGSCFPVGESMGEDLDLWLRACERGQLVITSEITALYRTELAGSLMAGRVFDNLFPFIQRLEQRALTGAMPPALSRSSLDWVGDARVSLARELIKSGRRREAVATLYRARRRIRSVRWWYTIIALFLPCVLKFRRG